MMMSLKVKKHIYFFLFKALLNKIFLIVALKDGIYLRTSDSIKDIAGTSSYTYFSGVFSSVYVKYKYIYPF